MRELTSGNEEDIERLPANSEILMGEGQHPALRTDNARVAHEGYFFDENRNARNVGLILMTANAPIDAAIVGQIGRSGDRAALQRIDRAAQGQQWQFELALVRCGFEAGGQQRRC